ncbi:T6SS immunity protein Tdi1 domain-containing protein, partial [Bacteroides hominis]
EGCLKRNFELKVSDFHKLVERLGLPAKDECYGYVPALALGGSKSLDNIQVVKMLPYIDMIAQMIGAFDMK